MKKLAKALLVGAFLLSIGHPAQAQVFYGLVTQPAARTLVKAYGPIEDAYCVIRAKVVPMENNPKDTVVVVQQIVQATMAQRDSSSISGISCPDSTISLIHTHPADATIQDCNFSRTDWTWMRLRGSFFEAIVCGAVNDSVPIVHFTWRWENPLVKRDGTQVSKKKKKKVKP